MVYSDYKKLLAKGKLLQVIERFPSELEQEALNFSAQFYSLQKSYNRGAMDIDQYDKKKRQLFIRVDSTLRLHYGEEDYTDEQTDLSPLTSLEEVERMAREYVIIASFSVLVQQAFHLVEVGNSYNERFFSDAFFDMGGKEGKKLELQLQAILKAIEEKDQRVEKKLPTLVEELRVRIGNSIRQNDGYREFVYGLTCIHPRYKYLADILPRRQDRDGMVKHITMVETEMRELGLTLGF